MKKKSLALLPTILFIMLVTSSASISTGASLDNFKNFGQVYGANSIYGILTSNDGTLWGITSGSESHLFTIDPATDVVSDKGMPPERFTLDLTWGADGLLYGSGFSFTEGGKLWSYDPAAEIFDVVGDVPGDRRVIGITTGLDGLIYLGTESGLDSSATGRLFSFNTATGIFIDRGTVTDATSVGNGLLTAPTGKVYGGTLSNGHLFEYDPSNGTLVDRGKAVSSESGVGALAVGSNGSIYGGTSPNGHLFSYNPISNTFFDIGQVIPDHRRVVSLTTLGNEIYGGTGDFSNASSPLPPHLFSYDINSGVISDFGVPAAGNIMITSVAAATKGVIYGGTGWGGHLFSYQLPGNSALSLNYRIAAPGSFLTLTASGFPPSSTATIEVNAQLLGNITTDADGKATFRLSTTNADEGYYTVTVSVNPSASASFTLDSTAPTRPPEGNSAIIEVPAGISFTNLVFLPDIRRE